MSTAVSLRLPDDLVAELDALGSRTDRPRTYLVRQAIEQYLEGHADYLIALERLRDKDDPVLTSDEARAELGF